MSRTLSLQPSVHMPEETPKADSVRDASKTKSRSIAIRDSDAPIPICDYRPVFRQRTVTLERAVRILYILGTVLGILTTLQYPKL